MPKTLGFWEWGCILTKSQKQELLRKTIGPVGVVVPLDEGNAGSREKPMWQ